ncbi:MAG: amino acid adenylation domain-containing protein [Candidatus Aminicenantes bacterium]|nr:MAG: amino acid adenylation domain-containing protein [Candidatus Aminicenantes bacterium]
MKVKASYHQERLWFIHQFESGKLYESAPTYHNIPLIIEIKGKLDLNLLKQSLCTVINRHEVLRTRMIAIEGELFQQVEPEVELRLAILDFTVESRGQAHKTPLNMAVEEAKHPFSPGDAPLIQAALIKISPHNNVLVIVLHHLVSDRCSLGTIASEFACIYQALQEGKSPRLPDLPLHYADFSQWQRQLPEDYLESLLFYWKRQLARLSPLELPTSRPRAAIHTFREARASFQLPGALSTKMREFSQQKGTGNHVLLQAAFKVLLHRYCGQEDITVGISVDNRHQPGIENLVGPAANLLVIRSRIASTMSFSKYFSDLTLTLEQAHENQDIPFDWLSLELNPRKDMSRTVFFDVLFQYEDESFKIPPIKGLELTYIETNLGWGKYDLNLLMRGDETSFTGILVYNQDYYEASFISEFIRHYQVLLESIIQEPDQPVSRLNMLSPEERHRLLVEWNQTRDHYPENKTIHKLFEEQAERTPDNIALVGQCTGREAQREEAKRCTLCAVHCAITYKKLNEKSNQLAILLKEKGVKPDTIAAIMLNRSVEMIIGLVGILKANGAYLPIDPGYPQERIHYILKDSGAEILLKDNDLTPEAFNNRPKGTSIPPSALPPFYPSHPSHLAYIIYTSGTTGRPKGCPVTHRNLVRLIKTDRLPFGFGEKDTWVMAHSFCFDFSVWEMYGALLNGGRLIVPPADLVRDVNLFLSLIKRQGVTVLNQTPQAFYALVEAEKKSQEQLLNHHLRCVIFGGDKILPQKLSHWIDMYSPGDIQLVNMYGITETTVHVTHYRLTPSDIHSPRAASPIGKPLPETTCYILDSFLNPVPIGITGEIYVGGTGVIPGYLNRVKLTALRFFENPHHPGEIIYKSGDLGRWHPDGNLEYLGRNDDQVKIRGFRIEPAEIENHILKHPAVKEAVVVSREDNNQTYLCAYLRLMPGEVMPEMRKYLSARLPHYMIPAYFTEVNAIPLTFNGKVDKKALPDPQIAKNKRHRIPPCSPVEETLVETWSEVLGMKKEVIGIDDDFFDLGGHSLNATVLIAKIHQKLHVKIPLLELFRIPKIKELAGYIAGRAKEAYTSIEPVEKKEYYPLSTTQKRLYILQQLVRGTTGYNIPYIITTDPGQKPGINKLEKTFKKLITRHESLRTSFKMVGVGPVQVIHNQVDFSIGYCEASEEESEEAVANFSRPFDLHTPPLLRVTLIRIGSVRQILFIDMHHIITDAASQRILEQEFRLLYEQTDSETTLAPLRLQYKDFSEWENSDERKRAKKQQEAYWTGEFSPGDEIPVLNLPTDYHRPLMQSFEGNTVNFAFRIDETKMIKKIARENDVTLYMCLLAVFNILFSKLSGQEDIILGSPLAARRHADLQNVIGMMVNTLAMRNFPLPHMPWKVFLKQVKQRTLEAYENQEYPFEDLVDNILVKRDTSRNPLFDVMFTFIDQSDFPGGINIPKIGDLTSYTYNHKKGSSRFDLTFSAVDLGEHIYFSVEYSTRLFTPASIDVFINYLRNIVCQLPVNTESKLSDIPMIPKEEKWEILKNSMGNEEVFDINKTIHRWFEDQVEKTPDNIALVSGNLRTQIPDPKHGAPFGQINTYGESSLRAESQELRAVTYKELNEKSNRLAHLLREKQIGPDSVVGLMLERSVEIIIGILAILKAGAAYLPLDSSFPGQRIQTMLNDSSVSLLLTQRNALPKKEAAQPRTQQSNRCKKEMSREILLVDEISELSGQYPGENPWPMNRTNDLLYVIYTSGSTGKPKGVMLEQGNLANLIRYQYNYTDIDFSRVLQFTTISFDVSAQEIFSTLLAGGQLSLVSRETLTDVPGLFKIVARDHIRTLFLPASFLKLVMNEEGFLQLIPGSVRHLVTAGEQVVVNKQFRDYLTGNSVYFHNHYGPSETHVVTAFTLPPTEEAMELPPIGRPVSNTCIYILDKGYHPVPARVPGELFIGGNQVGRGYLNNPELTCEKFKIKNGSGALRADLNAFGEGEGPQSPQSPHSPIYQTGDLARRLPDGNIEFLGRIDHQVKVRGFRVELGEIEARLMNHPGIKNTVVQAWDTETGEKYLCAYIISHRETTAAELREYLSKQLPEYMIPAYFVFLDEIPLTPNRKIDRTQLPKPDLKLADNDVPSLPGNEIETRLTGIFAEVLGIKKDVIGVHSDFFQLGGHSLRAISLAARVHKDLKVKLPLAEIFRTPAIRGLAQYIQKAGKVKFSAVEPVEKKEYYKLSASQQRLYILQHMDPASTAYNLWQVISLAQDMCVDRLENAFRTLIERHESLRTSFHMMEEKPVQKVHDNHNIKFKIEHFTELHDDRGETQSRIENFIKPFNLAQAPMLRVGLIQMHSSSFSPTAPVSHRKENPLSGYLLLVDMHHIISDGVSNGILVTEFFALYNHRHLPGLRIQYKDFSQWQNSAGVGKNIKTQEDYWLKEFKDRVPILDLPTDHVRPSIQSFEGRTLDFDIPPEYIDELESIASEEGATLYMVLLALINILLSKLSSQEDIIIGTPTAGRRHADLDKIIGMFVNTLALRNYPRGERYFKEFLQEVKTRALEAFENQEYQFEDLVDRVLVNRDISRNPLFDVMFVLQNPGFLNGSTADNNDIPVEKIIAPQPGPYDFQNTTAKFDLTLSAVKDGRNLLLSFQYTEKLFKEETIKRYIDYFKKIVSGIVENPGLKLKQIEIISEAEKRKVLHDFNLTETGYPRNTTLHHWFEKQVEKGPNHIALIGPGQIPVGSGETGDRFETPVYITAMELNRKSTGIARLLRAKGVKPNTIVGLMVESSIEMIIGILGILRAGGAYLPIDTNYPQERINYMLIDSGAEILLKDNDLTPGAFNNRPKGISIHPSTLPPFYPSRPSNLAYVIYTSGSTGRPKGVMVEHRNILNYISWRIRQYHLESRDVCLQLVSISFDGFCSNLYPLLLIGGKTVLLSREKWGDASYIRRVIREQGVTNFSAVPSMFRMLLEGADETDFRPVRFVVLAGEKADCGLVEAGKDQMPWVTFINEYGPTENSVAAAANMAMTARDTAVIGSPISNNKIFILDRHRIITPIGVRGELCISGDSLARGYLNRPELTADTFRREVNTHFSSVIGSPGKLSKSTNDQYPMTDDRLYSTGDLARWLPDGNIELSGRIDRQIKVRGYRIELGEIENHLLKHPQVNEVVVLVRGNQSEDKYICAYIVSELINQDDKKTAAPKELKKFLSNFLPEYMIPSYFTFIEKIPLTANGKIDREALPAPVVKVETQYTAPENEIQEKLVEIWSEVLGIKNDMIGIYADFFQLGGHSLRATIMVSRIKKEFNVVFPLVEIFKNPFIKSLSEYIAKARIEPDVVTVKDNRLLLLKPGARDDKHLFLIHDGTGQVEGYIEFCNRLTIDFNCWGICADRLENHTPLNFSIPHFARQYLETIKTLQPPGHGPFFISGWSLGGTIAFEIASQLEKAGERISYLGIFDAPGPQKEWKNQVNQFSLETELELVMKYFPGNQIKEKVKKAANINEIWPIIVNHLEENGIRAEIIKRLIPPQLAQIIPHFHQQGIKELISFLNINRTLTNARAFYIPDKKIHATLHYFKASESPAIFQDSWNDYCLTPLKSYEIPGDHFSILKKTNAAKTAEIVDAILNIL